MHVTLFSNSFHILLKIMSTWRWCTCLALVAFQAPKGPQVPQEGLNQVWNNFEPPFLSHSLPRIIHQPIFRWETKGRWWRMTSSWAPCGFDMAYAVNITACSNIIPVPLPFCFSFSYGCPLLLLPISLPGPFSFSKCVCFLFLFSCLAKCQSMFFTQRCPTKCLTLCS